MTRGIDMLVLRHQAGKLRQMSFIRSKTTYLLHADKPDTFPDLTSSLVLTPPTRHTPYSRLFLILYLHSLLLINVHSHVLLGLWGTTLDMMPFAFLC